MSLARVLEPEVMDTMEEAQAYDAMDHTTVNQAFVEDLLATGPLAGELLDVGTGTAQIPVRLCQQAEEVRVFAVDLSYDMLDVARFQVETHMLLDRILLDHVDAKTLPFEDGRFDGVLSNSIVHHIPDPQTVFAEAVRVCRPGGILFFRDLIRPDSEAELAQLVQEYAASEAPTAQQMFADSLRAALTVEEGRAIVTKLGFEAVTMERSSDRHWTWSARKPEA